MLPFRIDPAASVGLVSLTVSDLAASASFYDEVLGLHPLDHGAGELTLSADRKTPLLELVEQSGAKHYPRSTGLFHFALLVPSRVDLARWLRHFTESGYPLQGAADHLVSEALYLSDPDGNGIEIYRDRRQEEWQFDGSEIRMATDPLNLQQLLSEADEAPWTGIDPGTIMGHVHLQVSNVGESEQFYRDVLGFDLMLHFGRSASFLSAGGYHHHIGVNTWNSAGAEPPPPGSVGLRHFSVLLPNSEALTQLRARLAEAGVVPGEDSLLRDPSENGILLSTRPQT